jgi:hypothetical protein
MIHDEKEYLLIYRQLLAEPTPREHARASRIASQTDFDDRNVSTDPLVQSKLLKRKQRANALTPLIIHYTYDRRFAHYKSKIHQQWSDSFRHAPLTETKLLVGTKKQPKSHTRISTSWPLFSKNNEN